MILNLMMRLMNYLEKVLHDIQKMREEIKLMNEIIDKSSKNLRNENNNPPINSISLIHFSLK